MYCSEETKRLAISKGYKVCSCSCGGYPDCICEENLYHPVRLDDLQRWLYLKNIWVSINCDFCPYDWLASKQFSRDITRFDVEYNSGSRYIFGTPDSALEDGIQHALNFI